MNRPSSRTMRKFVRRQRAALLKPSSIAKRRRDALEHAAAHRG